MKRLITILIALTAPIASAAYLDDIGFTELKLLHGSGLATGSGVLPTLVEAPVEVEDGGVVKEVWSPDPANAELIGVTFLAKTPIPLPLIGIYSGHATGTARRMVGETTSMTPGVPVVEVYEADDWLSSFLKVGNAGSGPLSSGSRIANHSWIGNYDNTADNIDALRRLDWIINRDEFIQVVGNSNGSPLKPLLANAFNSIAVGRTDGSHSSGSLALDVDYVAGRANPHLVAPLGTSSAATSLVSSAATLLIDTAQSTPALSLEADIVPRAGATIKSAAASEVIKAVLMAGADRTTENPGPDNITDYRQGAANRTANGLDTRFGAGQLNILDSHEILIGGEQNSLEDGGGSLLWSGFDYDPTFGGALGSNATANYYFTTEGLAAEVRGALVWNLSIDEGPGYDLDPTLYNLDLQLWQLDAGGDVLIASSLSTIDNTENIWTTLLPDGDYSLRVVHGESTDFLWDYALAWQLQAVPVPAALPLAASALVLLSFWRRR